MMAVDRDQKIDVLFAEREVREIAHVCAHYVDRGNIEGLRTLFHPDAIAEYGFNKSKTVEEFLAHFEIQRQGLADVQHHITTNQIKIDGDYAEAEVYAIAHCLMEDEGGTKTFMIGGRYLDKYERRDGVWKIAHRLGLEDWSVKVPTPPRGSNDLVGEIPRGAIGEADPGYAFFKLIR